MGCSSPVIFCFFSVLAVTGSALCTLKESGKFTSYFKK